MMKGILLGLLLWIGLVAGMMYRYHEPEVYNVGNIVKTKTAWTGEVPCEGRFKCFSTKVEAKNAVSNLLKGYYSRYRLQTINGIMHRYTPPTENDTFAVVDTMSKITGYHPFLVLDMTDEEVIQRLTEAIIRVEGNT